MSNPFGIARRSLDTEERIQRNYYRATANSYSDKHESGQDAHATALDLLNPLLQYLEVESMVDVGTGAGRAIHHFRQHRPNMTIVGVDPVQELLDEAINRGIPRNCLLVGTGEKLPFADNSFDASCEFGMLHHVRQPDLVIKEMIRVSRRCVILSDSNRFGQGPFSLRVAKLLLYKLGVWHWVNLVKTHGSGYSLSEGDGLAYSYSVFDSYSTLAHWATRILLLPTEPATNRTWMNPLLASSHVLVCAIRD